VSIPGNAGLRALRRAERAVNRRAGKRALATPGRPGVRKIAARFGVNPETVQRISRPFVALSVVAAVL
jgi:DNA-binding transcriptional regulator YhcF (GntR family)